MLLRILLMMSLPCALHAGQPLSHSMAQCSALYDVVEMSMMSRPDRARARYAADTWAAYAAAQARREGRKVSTVDHTRLTQRKDWGSSTWFPASEAFRDWAAYCKSLALEKDVPYDPMAQN